MSASIAWSTCRLTAGIVDLGASEFDPGAMGCKVADLAAPIGSFDFSDVVASLGAFGAGCP